MALNDKNLRKIQGCMKCAFHLGIAKDHGKEAEFLEIVGRMFTQISQGLKCDQDTIHSLEIFLAEIDGVEIDSHHIVEAGLIVKALQKLRPAAPSALGIPLPALG